MHAIQGEAVTLTLEDEIDISRGDMIIRAGNSPHVVNHLQAMVVWMSEQELSLNKEYYFKIGVAEVSGRLEKIDFKIDVNTLEKSRSATQLSINEIAQCQFVLSKPVIVDNYTHNRITGGFIIIDRLTDIIVAAGMIQLDGCNTQ